MLYTLIHVTLYPPTHPNQIHGYTHMYNKKYPAFLVAMNRSKTGKPATKTHVGPFPPVANSQVTHKAPPLPTLLPRPPCFHQVDNILGRKPVIADVLCSSSNSTKGRQPLHLRQ